MYKRYVLQCFHEATLILKIYQVKCGAIRLKNGWCKTKALHNSQQCSAGPRRDTVPTAWWTWKMDECRVSCASTKTDFLARTRITILLSLSLSTSLYFSLVLTERKWKQADPENESVAVVWGVQEAPVCWNSLQAPKEMRSRHLFVRVSACSFPVSALCEYAWGFERYK